MDKISGVIITFNEEKNIERCINSMKEVCDEIIVVDSYSTDKTAQICQAHNVKFIQNKFIGHIEQKNFAMNLAQCEYILSLDADEALSDALLQSIKSAKKKFTFDSYSFNRLTNYCGHWVKHCDWYPDVKIRLWHREKGKWGGTNPHDLILMNSNSTNKHLDGDLLHYSYNTISEHVAQTNKFTSIAARALHQEQRKSNILTICTRPVLKFLKDYFLRLGFMDGYYGFVICCINSLSALLKYSKLYELQRNKDI